MNLDDPKLAASLTAYALGELSDVERRAVEAQLEGEPEARAFVEETAAFAGMLAKEFKAEGPSLRSETGAKELMARFEAERGDSRRVIRRRMAWGMGVGAIAAALVVAAVLPMTVIVQQKASTNPELAEVARAAVRENLPKSDVTLGAPAATSAPELEGKLLASARADLSIVPEPSAPAAPVATEMVTGGDSRMGQALTAKQVAEVGSYTGSWAKRAKIQRSAASLSLGEAISANALDSNTEAYSAFDENPFLGAMENPLSTFSIDVDTASYSNVRRFLSSGRRPPKGAVRIEELINYFHYDYPQPKGDVPFSTTVEVAQCPWQPAHRLVRIGLKGRELPEGARAASNLVFLLDVSGSMDEPNKLPLLKQSLRLLVEKLGENDRVSVVVYAGAAGLVLPPTRGDQKEKILKALEELQPGGSTNGAGGIQLAYEIAVANLIPKGTNRVILATDGDFNVGMRSESDLVDLIQKKAKTGVYLTVLGFGGGNLQDSTMKKLSTYGNGNYAYIDSLREGRKVLVEQIGGTLVTIAKDVKIQVEFNPAVAASYRLVGYENRMLRKEDFNDDKKDAGEIGAGHTVTALYEVIPAGTRGVAGGGTVDPLKYQKGGPTAKAGEELLTVKLRYKEPTGADVSRLIEQAVKDDGEAQARPSGDLLFAAAVAEFGMLLRNSPHSGNATWETARELAADGKGEDRGGYRSEFLELIEKAKQLQ